MSVEQSLEQVLTAPTTAAVWQLKGDLLARGMLPEAPLIDFLGQYHIFLGQLSSTLSAVEYNKMAYWLNVASAMVSIADDWVTNWNILKLFRNLVPTGLDEGLDVLAAKKYVDSAESQLTPHNNQAAWSLYTAIWHFSTQAQPDLPSAERRQHLDQLFAPIHAEENPATKSILIGRLYQLMILTHLAT